MPACSLADVTRRVPKQEALGLQTVVPLTPCALERFRPGRLLTARYGVGAGS